MAADQLTVERPGAPAARVSRRPASLWSDAFRRLCRNRGALVGGVVVALVALLAIAAPLIAPYDPIKVSASEALQPPSAGHLFGTDQFGRDLFTRVLYGGQLSLR